MQGTFLFKLTTAAGTGLLAPYLQQAPNATPKAEPPKEVRPSEANLPWSDRPVAIRELVKQHFAYLREVSIGSEPLITRSTASIAVRAWLDVSDATGNALPVPAACTGPDGQMMYTWDKERHHLELEITADGAGEFFYRNRETSELWGEEYRPGTPLAHDVVTKLKLFI
jgi:hypothetical protein